VSAKRANVSADRFPFGLAFSPGRHLSFRWRPPPTAGPCGSSWWQGPRGLDRLARRGSWRWDVPTRWRADCLRPIRMRSGRTPRTDLLVRRLGRTRRAGVATIYNKRSRAVGAAKGPAPRPSCARPPRVRAGDQGGKGQRFRACRRPPRPCASAAGAYPQFLQPAQDSPHRRFDANESKIASKRSSAPADRLSVRAAWTASRLLLDQGIISAGRCRGWSARAPPRCLPTSRQCAVDGGVLARAAGAEPVPEFDRPGCWLIDPTRRAAAVRREGFGFGGGQGERLARRATAGRSYLRQFHLKVTGSRVGRWRVWGRAGPRRRVRRPGGTGYAVQRPGRHPLARRSRSKQPFRPSPRIDVRRT